MLLLYQSEIGVAKKLIFVTRAQKAQKKMSFLFSKNKKQQDTS
jgi:deoxyinosine 3'endonuclease (endonuclease V)